MDSSGIPVYRRNSIRDRHVFYQKKSLKSFEMRDFKVSGGLDGTRIVPAFRRIAATSCVTGTYSIKKSLKSFDKRDFKLSGGLDGNRT
jgi:hypothetical protein